MKTSIVIKIGGSLINNNDGETLRNLGNIISQYAIERPIYIVPGGGPFADHVRRYGKKFGLSEQTCHFMALAAMDQYAYLLKEFIPNSVLTDLSDSLSPELTPIAVPQIFLCSRFLSRIPANKLPRSWDVTSDSISAYLTKQFNLSRLFVIKSTDIDPAIKEPGVDPYFRQLLPLHCPIWFINGLYPERLSRLLRTGTTQGIKVSANSSHCQSVL